MCDLHSWLLRGFWASLGGEQAARPMAFTSITTRFTMTIADVARVAVGASVSLTMLISGCGRQSSEPTNTGLVRVGSVPEMFQRVTLPSTPIERSDAQVLSVTKPEERWLFPRIMAGGSGVCDLNLDGRLDLIVVDSHRIPTPSSHIPYCRCFSKLSLVSFRTSARLRGFRLMEYRVGLPSPIFPMTVA